MGEFGFVRCSHHHHIRQGCQIGDIEAAGVGAAIRTDQSGPVDRKAHRQILDGHVVDNLVIGALEECRIDGAEGAHALRGKAGSKGHPMLFGDPDIKGLFGMGLGKSVDASAGRHGGGNRADTRIAVGELGERFSENILIGRRSAAGPLVLFAGDNIKLGDAVIFVVRFFGKFIAFALFGDDMDQAGPFRSVANIFKDGNQMLEIVAVNRADIIEAQFLEQGTAHGHATGKFVGLTRCIMERLG